MAIFNDADFSQAHDMITCCILEHLIQGVQQFGQKVSGNLYEFTMLIL